MIISKTPLRISFVGGGSDLEVYYKNRPGAVLSTTIDKYIYVIVNKRTDNMIRVSYSKTEWEKNVNDIEHKIIREALKTAGINSNIDISYVGDLPINTVGTGLGASSAIAVGTLNALYAFMGRHVLPETLAQEACKIEIEKLGNPIGKQDQYAVAYGGINYIQFKSDESVLIEPLILDKEIQGAICEKMLLFYTGLISDSKVVLTEQKAKTKDNLQTLDKMVDLVSELRKALFNKEISKLGDLLHQNWMHKQTLASKITNNIINQYYEKARQAGATGGKILGSGGGGFLLFYCEEKYQDGVRRALADLQEMPFKFEPEGSKIVYTSN